MTFLQPILLWGLPAALLPVVIHLLNRLRFRSVKWAAMMFLIAATRSSTKRARLRHYLLLLCRVLVVLLFILALSRPTVGGWLGGTMAGAPDTVIILLDRSASMEAHDPRRQCSKREHALRLFAQAATESAASSRFVLIESVTRKPHEIAAPSVLSGLSLAAETDTAADIPAMFQAALDYMIRSETGRTELWVASDLQVSNWYPQRRAWQRLSAQMAALPQDVSVRLLAMSEGYRNNVSVALRLAQRQKTAQQQYLELALDVSSAVAGPQAFPIILTLDGTRSQDDISLATQTLHYHRKMELLPDSQTGGWGKVELPADENARDNTCYFVYGDSVALRTVVVSDSPLPARYLRLATAPAPGLFDRTCEVIPSSDVGSILWQDLAMLIWQAPAPDAETEALIRTFIEKGGSVISFPPGMAGASGAAVPSADSLFGAQWGPVDVAAREKPFRVPVWDERDGPLADTADGLSLQLDRLTIYRRQVMMMEGATNTAWSVLARFVDGKPFLVRQAMQAGRLFACASLPRQDWSDLGDGRVLVPLLQRILWQGGERLAHAETAECGAWKPMESQEVWTCVDSDEPKNPQWRAGVYQSGTQRVALNTPAREAIPDAVDVDTVPELFGDVRVQVLDDLSTRSADKLQSEIWPLFLFLSLAFLLMESGLLLMNRQARDKTPTGRMTV